MASKKIQGITVEIGGNTTKLGKALENVEKKTMSLQGELKDVNKLLKLDPGNTELVAQKQAILTQAVEETTKKLDTMREAEEQVIAQFERGEIGEDTLRSFQREIERTELKLKDYSDSLKDMTEETKDVETATEKLEKTISKQEDAVGSLSRKYSDVVLSQGKNSKEAKALKKEIDNLNDELGKNKKKLEEAKVETKDLADAQNEAGETSGKLASALKGGLKAGAVGVASAVAGTATAFLGSAESTREYRNEMAKLETAFSDVGFTSLTAHDTFKNFYAILGDEGQTTEAVSHLAELANTKSDLVKWTDIATGVYAKFGDSLPIENLTEASNETAKTGQITGGLADALNWAGASEEEFQKKLDKCSTEQERQSLITETLNGLYKDASETYKEVNGDVMDAQRAQAELNDAMAGVGAVAEPVMSTFKLMGAELINSALPGVEKLGEGFTDLVNGVDGAGDKVGSAISDLLTTLLNKIIEVAPMLIETGLSLVSNLIQGILSALPQLVTTAVNIVVTLLGSLGTVLPQIVSKVIEIIPLIISSLTSAIPLLLESAVSFLMTIVKALPPLIVALSSELPKLVTTIVEMLIELAPLILESAITLFMAIVDALPMILEPLGLALYQIVQALYDLTPEILKACWDLVVMLVKEIPGMLLKIVTAIWDIVVMLGTLYVDLWKMEIDFLVKMATGIWNWFTEILPTILEWCKKIWSGITKVFSVVGSWFKNIFSSAWTGIKNVFSSVGSFFSGIWGKVREVFSGVGSWFGNIFSGAWSKIKAVFSGWGSFFGNLWTTIKTKFSSIGTNIANAISGAVKRGINGVISSIESTINRAIGLINGAIGIINKLPGVSVSTIGTLNFPRLARGGIVDSPTLAEIGEDGREAVLPLENNTGWIEDIARKINDFQAEETTHTAGLEIVGAKLEKIYDKLDKMKQNIVLDTGVLVGETINQIDTSLGNIYTLRERGV